MAPIQQQCTESSLLNKKLEKVNEMKSSSKVQSETKSSSSATSHFNSSRSISSSIDNTSNASLEGRTSNMDWPSDNLHTTLLPIATRGLFYNDSFFEESRKDFDKAVKQVLDKWGPRSLEKDIDDLSSYRRMRELDLHDKNQAVSVTQDEKNHKVVIDVRDFMDSEINVKIIEEKELVVEGSFDKKDGCSISKKSFQRRFTFSDLIKSDAVTSVMSSDGVLTITIPKESNKNKSTLNNLSESSHSKTSSVTKNKVMELNGRTNECAQDTFDDISFNLLPVTEKGRFFQDSFFESARKGFEASVTEILKKFGNKNSLNGKNNMEFYRDLRLNDLKEENQAISVNETDDHHKVTMDVKDFKDGDLKVKIVDENDLKVEGKTERKSDGVSSNKSFCRSFTFPGLIKANSVTSAMSSDGILTVTIPKEKRNTTQHVLQHESINIDRGNSFSNSNTAITDVVQESSNKDQLSEPLLHIFERGNFFHDDFFASVRHDFENAVKEVLTHFGESTSSMDNISTYRNLRNKDLKEENQAVTTSEDRQSHKVVIDVHDFMNDDLKVRVIDENELVVEGKVEKKEEGSLLTKKFTRSFRFPGLVSSDAVSSTLSSDGVLIVTVPKNMRNKNNALTDLQESKSNIQRNTSSSYFLQKNSSKNSSFQHETKMENKLMKSDFLNSSMERDTLHKSFNDCAQNFEIEADKMLSNLDESNKNRGTHILEAKGDRHEQREKRTTTQQNYCQEMKMSSLSTSSYCQSSTSKQVSSK